MAPTIRDVAELAGVHPSTVSRVFSGNEKISKRTRQRVMEAAHHLGFHPNAVARSLSRRLSNTLGLVIPHMRSEFFEDPFFPQVVKGLMTESYPHNFRLIIAGSDSREEELDQSLALLRSRHADGIIVLTSHLDGATIQELRANTHPFVIVGRPALTFPDLSWVNTDNIAATALMTTHLLDLGHRQIAFIGGRNDAVVTADRLAGYRQALRGAGIPFDEGLIEYGNFHQEGGTAAMARLLARRPTLTGVVVASDLMAVGAMEALAIAGRRVPDDISIVGSNDSALASLMIPPLTSSRVPYAELARLAAHALIEMVLGERDEPFTRLLPCPLIVRGSTAPAGGVSL